MILYLTVDQVLQLHDWSIQSFGGESGVLHPSVIESAVAAPAMTFDGKDLYATIEAKAAALAFPIVHDHPFVDGNKRTGVLAAGMFARLNGCGFKCDVDVAEGVTVAVAAGKLGRDEFAKFLGSCIGQPPPAPDAIRS